MGSVKKKSAAKAVGVKSTFKVADDCYIMTAFGKGNESIMEKNIHDRVVFDISENRKFDANINSDNDVLVDVSKGSLMASVELPEKDNNLLQAKRTIEKIYFGRSFNDNIHIQMAYKVMDMKKILSVYANDIIYSINNLLSAKGNQDFLGMFPTMNQFDAARFSVKIIKTGLVEKGDKGIRINADAWNKNKRGALSELDQKMRKYYKKSGGEYVTYKEISRYIIDVLGFSKYEYIESTANNTSAISPSDNENDGSYDTVNKKAKGNLLNVDKFANLYSDMFAVGQKVDAKRVYESIRLLGAMRQTAFHSNEYKSNANKPNSTNYTLLNINETASSDTKKFLDEITVNKFTKVNKNFLSQNNKVNFDIIFSAFPNEDKKELILELYNFSVRKTQKNMGFSIKTLREVLLEEQASLKPLGEKEYDSIRSKLYSMIDFVIYKYYKDDKNNAQENFIDKLRGLVTSKDEEEKKKLYITEAKRLWPNINGTVVRVVIPKIDKCKAGKGGKVDFRIDKQILDSVKKDIEKYENISYFSKAIYCICSFLDGKEINMLLDSLINNFESINSFQDVINQKITKNYCGEDAGFLPAYSLFNDCGKYADELRLVKSIARMNKTQKAAKTSDVNIKKWQYVDACSLLGETNVERIIEELNIGEKKDEKGRKVDHTLRNFLINNVINSTRYNYVIRYVDPKDARAIMQNEKLVSFVISQIDEKQIIRYYKSAFAVESTTDVEEMRKQLTRKLLLVKFDTFTKVSNDRKLNVEKERLKALVRLYLTVLYLLTKSIVRINTSYSIAFAVFERDSSIFNFDMKEKNIDGIKSVSVRENSMVMADYLYEKSDARPVEDIYKKYSDIAPKDLLNKGKPRLTGREKARICVDMNKRFYTNVMFSRFRNIVEHLNAVSSLGNCSGLITKDIESYFDLYHFLVLKALYTNTIKTGGSKYSEEMCQVIKEALTHQSAYKDFLYGVLAPFSYNPARYANLTSKQLFIKSYGN